MTSVFSSSVQEMPWLIRADFSSQIGWEQVAHAVGAGAEDSDEGEISFVVVDDSDFDGLTPARLLTLEPYPYGTFFLVDRETVTHQERPLLAVDVHAEPGRSFRLIPSEVEGFAVNMLIANMDFADFADNVDPDGIFRGFASGQVSTLRQAPIDQPAGSVDMVDVVCREADPDDANSFIGQLIREGFWNPASWQRLEAGMREACRRYDSTAEVPRRLTAAFHSVMVRTPNLVALPGMIPMDPGAVEVRLERISALSAWFFRGWTMERFDGPLPGEYDPTVSHG